MGVCASCGQRRGLLWCLDRASDGVEDVGLARDGVPWVVLRIHPFALIRSIDPLL